MVKKDWTIFGIIVGAGLIISAIIIYSKNSDFANKIYAKCLDVESSNINIDNLYSDSYDVAQRCHQIRSKAFFGKSKYEKCISQEKIKIGTTFKEYINYLYGGYMNNNGCTGYYLCRPYEEYAKLYKDEADAFLDAYDKMEIKCLDELFE